MASLKPEVIDLATRTVCAHLRFPNRPRFHDTRMVVGHWQGHQVEAQFSTGFLHGMAGPHWVRFELDGPERMYSVALYPDGCVAMVRGGAGITPHYTSHFAFRSIADLEQILNMVGEFIANWQPATETA